MTVLVNVDEWVLKSLKQDLDWAIEDEDEVEIKRLTEIYTRLDELDNRFTEVKTLKEFGELIEELKDWELKVDIGYDSHFEQFDIWVEFV